MPVPSLDPSTTALVVIDLQKGIVTPPAEPHPATDVIANAARLAHAFRRAHATVALVHVVMSHDRRDRLTPLADEPMYRGGGAPAADFSTLVPELDRQPTDLVIGKHQWGAFYGTELDLQLRRRGVKTIVLCGIATNYGVESTARDAFERGYDIVFVEDAMSSRAAADHEFSVTRLFPRIGRVVLTDEAIDAIAAGAR